MVGALYTGITGWVMLGENVSGDKIMPGVGWRGFAVVSAVPAMLALFCTVNMLPESPKFLVRMGKYDQAVRYIILCIIMTYEYCHIRMLYCYVFGMYYGVV